MPTVHKPGNYNGQHAHWKRPTIDHLKVNCDASFHQKGGDGSWGAVIRDHEGDVVSSGSGKVNHLLNAFQAKLITCFQGIQMAVSLGIGGIIIETD